MGFSKKRDFANGYQGTLKMIFLVNFGGQKMWIVRTIVLIVIISILSWII